MREITINLERESPRPIYCFGGYEGEHHATLLKVGLPQAMLEQNADHYRFVLETPANEEIFSAALTPENGFLSLLLPQAVMLAPELKVQAASYRYDGEELIFLEKTQPIRLSILNPIPEKKGDWEEKGQWYPQLIIDETVTEESKNPVSGKAVFAALEEKLDRADYRISETVEETGTDPVSGKAVSGALETAKNEVEERMRPCYANALLGTKQGSQVAVTDLSPLYPILSVSGLQPGEALSCHGKNVIPFPYTESSKSEGNVRFTVEKDFGITVSIDGGVSDNNAYFIFGKKELGAYSINASDSAASNGVYTASSRVQYNGSNKNVTLFIPQGYVLEEPVTFYPQLELGTVSTPYEAPKPAVLLTADSQGCLSLEGEGNYTLYSQNNSIFRVGYHRDLNQALEAIQAALLRIEAAKGGNMQ